MFNVQVFVL